MKNKLMCVAAFSLGAAVGAAVSWKVLKTKYEQITQDEINAAKEYYRTRAMEELEAEESCECEDSDEEDDEPANTVAEYEPEPVKTVADNYGPYVISPDEFGDIFDYNTQHLTYYADDEILADESDESIDDIDGTIGLDSLNHFGEFEDEVVFIRNDELKTDYEVFYDSGSYYAVLLNNLYSTEE